MLVKSRAIYKLEQKHTHSKSFQGRFRGQFLSIKTINAMKKSSCRIATSKKNPSRDKLQW